MAKLYLGNREVTPAIAKGTTPSGTYTVTENGTYDVTNYASAAVNVSGGSNPIEIYLYIDQPNESAYYHCTIGVSSNNLSWEISGITTNTNTKIMTLGAPTVLTDLVLEGYTYRNPAMMFSYLYTSTDGVSWSGPYSTYEEGQTNVQTSYLITPTTELSEYTLTQTAYFKVSNS